MTATSGDRTRRAPAANDGARAPDDGAPTAAARPDGGGQGRDDELGPYCSLGLAGALR